MDNNESSIVVDNSKNQESLIKNDDVNNNVNIDNNENNIEISDEDKKLNTENIEKFIPLNDELFDYHEDNIKNDVKDRDDNIYNYKDDESKNYVTSSGDGEYNSISENSFKLLRDEIICNHKINVISEESENDEVEEERNKYTDNNENNVAVDKDNKENNINVVTSDEIKKENMNGSDSNISNIKYASSPIEDMEYRKDNSNGSLSFIRRESSIKDLNDIESFNFETASIADNKSIATNSIFSLNKESYENINTQNGNDALLPHSFNFSRSKTNYAYDNDFDYLKYFKKAEEYIKSYNVDTDIESTKRFLMFKPFYTIANGIISKQLNENEKFNDSSFFLFQFLSFPFLFSQSLFT